MGLRSWIKRLERDARQEMVEIPQQDGTTARFPLPAARDAFLNLCERLGAEEDAPPEYPLVTAARNSSDPAWSESFYASGGSEWTEPVEDLSE